MSNDYQEKKEEIRKTREEIIKSLKGVVEILQGIREKCKINTVWNRGETGKDLDRIINELKQMADGLIFPEPERVDEL